MDEQTRREMERRDRVRTLVELYLERGWSPTSPDAFADILEDTRAEMTGLLAAWNMEQAFNPEGS